jgi:hypothetical protein
MRRSTRRIRTATAATSSSTSFHINRLEFPAVLQLARQVNPALSADPKTYSVESFGLKDEVVGTASLGLNVESMQVSVERP